MNPTLDPPVIVSAEATQRRPGFLARALRAHILDRLGGLRHGRIIIHDADLTRSFGDGDPCVTVRVHDPSLWMDLATHGTVGVGAAWIDGAWTCDDAVGLVRILLRNREILDGLEGGLARFAGAGLRAWHALNRNSRARSRRNIAAHYDLGNDFFSRWLDPTLLYSSADYGSGAETLYDAQIAKCERLCRSLELGFDDHLLEIGTGWGGFAIHAARTYGCRVTTTTISRQQYDLARERVRAAGLESRIQVLCEDYRALSGTYDKLVSIEMIEAVGHQFYDTYFSACSRLLKPDGLFAMQAITIAERQYEAALTAVDYIQRYVFPGSTIPSISALTASCGRSSDFDLVALHDLTPDYARTLAAWRSTFHEQAGSIAELGYDERFRRLWDFYLAYCEGGFAERAIGCVQLTFARSGWRSGRQRVADA
jgi:cyclopropane-fatty-acyl-phospholipid synthase